MNRWESACIPGLLHGWVGGRMGGGVGGGVSGLGNKQARE